MLPALAAALVLASTALTAEPESSPLTATVAVGAGWDTNLTRLPGAGPSATASLVGWHGSAGWIFTPGEAGALLLEATYAGEQYAEEAAPSTHRPGASATWVRPLGERLRLRLGAFGAWSASEDPARRGVDGGLSASLGLVVAEPLQLRVGVVGLRSEAASAAWSTHRTRLRASAALTPWHGASLVAGYAWQVGTDTAWLEPPAAPALAVAGYGPGGGAGGGAGSGTGSWLTSTLVPVATAASAHVLSVDAEQALGAGLFVAAGWSYTSGTSAVAGPWSGQAVQLEVGWRR